MKLFYAQASPFARKVLVTAHETGLAPRIELVATATSGPTAPELVAHNPLGKVPTLVTDEGESFYDSPVICEYLDTLHGGTRLFPGEGRARWQALRWQALGDGIMDAAVSLRYEQLRPEGEKSPAWQERQKGKILASARALEGEMAELAATPLGIGHIAIACALGYVDFRMPEIDWRQGNAGLADWIASFAARPSMAATAPRG